MKNNLAKVTFPDGSIVCGKILKTQQDTFLFKYFLGESEFSVWLPIHLTLHKQPETKSTAYDS